MAKSHFNASFFGFFEELARNNNREWFQRNKHRYEAEVRDPMLTFIADLAPRLRKMSKYYVADPRPSGGSMFRIYRNLRFSRDKTPYKTNAAAAIHHSNTRGWPSPAFYFHFRRKRFSAASAFGIRMRTRCARYAMESLPGHRRGRRRSATRNSRRAWN